ncbi:hypothetical protein NBZ79_17535 [Sneathiella marina]|uniref:Uncharacterized protein n=1 Tax=Sneathiella marina TaxID=2950108 RepID=A0ABY4W4Y6_9PROT|nr:hypothetical protein [Sneathiella marina]USG60962.1 hypothetical protein NBZ79_17535 [Sneathiella marina]
MIIGRLIGWVCIAIAFMVLGRDLLQFLNTGELHFILLGELWYNLFPEGLNLAQAVVQRYLFPSLWDPVILTVLLWPAWLDFFVPGLVLIILFRKRKNRKKR